MPLRDHFHPPLSTRRHWQGFLSKWTSAIVDQLDQLPERYFAEPTIHYGAQVEVDVATLEEQTASATAGGIATAVWSPARPTLTVSLPAASFEAVEVRIVHDEEGPRLVAAIELVSPGNKDRAFERRAFAIKCRAYLQQGVSLIVVDMVTSRAAKLASRAAGPVEPAGRRRPRRAWSLRRGLSRLERGLHRVWRSGWRHWR